MSEAKDSDYDEFFSRREWLEYAYRYARALRMSPWGFVGAILSRVCALTPPNIVVQLTRNDRPFSLNTLIALVGPTGSGKGKLMANSRYLIPAPLLSPLREVSPKTGESIPAEYITKIPAVDGDGKPIKGEYTDKIISDRCLMFMPEILSMGAAMSRQGSTLLPILLTAFSNEPLGDDTKGKQYQMKMPPYSYRFAALVGVQPSNSGILFDQTNAGLAGRFIYLPSTDPAAPERVDKPDSPVGEFPFDVERLPVGNSFARIEDLLRCGSREAMPGRGELGYPLNPVTFPSDVEDYADDMQRRSVLGNQKPLDSHRIELIAKVAALFRIMEDCIGVGDARPLPADHRFLVTMDDWALALTLMAVSDRTRSLCDQSRRESAVASQADFLSSRMDAQDAAESQRLETVKRIVVSYLERHDEAREGVVGYVIRRGTGKYGRQCYQAIEALYDEGRLEKVGTSSDKTSGTIWSLSA
jgi:hypothetical protein